MFTTFSTVATCVVVISKDALMSVVIILVYWRLYLKITINVLGTVQYLKTPVSLYWCPTASNYPFNLLWRVST